MATVPLLVVFICGVDYEYMIPGHKRGRPVDWSRTSQSRERQLLQTIGSRPLTFVTFDLSRGTVVEKTYESRMTEPKIVPRKDWKPITAKEFSVAKVGGDEDVIFTGKTSEHLGAETIYKLILALVAGRSAKILELSIFSHAYAYGPILANTYPFHRVQRVRGEDVLVDIAGAPPGTRDPDDFDFRATDFSGGGGQSDASLRLWKSAFAPQGYGWVWGCNEDHLVKILMRVMKSGRPVMTRSTKAATKFKVTLRDHQLAAIRRISQDLVAETDKKTVYEIEFGQFKAAIDARLKGTYAQCLANGIGRTVYSAAPGTAATYASNGIDMILDSFSPEIVQIYKSIFGKSVDPLNLGYIAYLGSSQP